MLSITFLHIIIFHGKVYRIVVVDFQFIYFCKPLSIIYLTLSTLILKSGLEDMFDFFFTTPDDERFLHFYLFGNLILK